MQQGIRHLCWDGLPPCRSGEGKLGVGSGWGSLGLSKQRGDSPKLTPVPGSHGSLQDPSRGRGCREDRAGEEAPQVLQKGREPCREISSCRLCLSSSPFARYSPPLLPPPPPLLSTPSQGVGAAGHTLSAAFPASSISSISSLSFAQGFAGAPLGAQAKGIPTLAKLQGAALHLVEQREQALQ